MTINYRILVAALLGLSGLMLSSLVPGGPIENRDFSHINPSLLLVFNIYLTVLGIGSFVLIRYVLHQSLWGWRLSMVAGLSYLVVYGVDLAKFFPKTPSVMSPALFSIEVLGSLIAVPLMILSYQALQRGSTLSSEAIQAGSGRLFFAAIGLAGLIIVFFATCSAMSPQT